jgi:ferredoxin-like protein FixX
MRDYINKLLNDREQHNQKIKAIDRAIKAIQDLCPHNYEKIGHDHNYKYFKCTECGHETSE